MKQLQLRLTKFPVAFFVIFFLAAMLRWWQLAQYPTGFHQDELWFAYNGMLLKDIGTNIYGERWPLSVDMWGDHVSASHSYAAIPFFWLLGVNEFAFRSVTVVFSLLTLLGGSLLIWQLTKRKVVVLVFALLFAISPWNLVMTRASSTVIIDTFVLVILLNWWLFFLRWVGRQSALAAQWQKVVAGSLVAYVLTIVAYFTYFTSRLLIPAFLMGISLIVFFEFRKKWQRFAILTSVMVGAYLVFPFFTFLQTPYALGRFKETTIVNSQTVQGRLFQYIARSGQAGLPPWLTRVLYNKVTVNAEAIAQQTLGLLSPSTLLFQTSPPARYHVPGGSALSYLEYFAILAALGIVFFQSSKKSPHTKIVTAVLLGLTVFAVIPSALTEDDFPNMQRAVLMTPFVQMVAAVGIVELWSQWRGILPTSVRKSTTLFAFIILASLPTFTYFLVGYFAQARFERPHFRGRAAEELGRWINANAHDVPMAIDNVEGTFLYPYFYNQENILNEEIVKEGKYFLSNQQFSIGHRTFVKGLCTHEEMYKEKYQYIILYTFQKEPCPLPKNTFQSVYEAKYDDGNVGFTVYQRLPTSEVTKGSD